MSPRSAMRSRLTCTAPVARLVAVAEVDGRLDHLLHRLLLVVADHVPGERPRRPRSSPRRAARRCSTRMPRPHSSCASALVSPVERRLRRAVHAGGGGEALHAGTAGPARACAVALDTLTIHPSPRSSIAGSTAWARSSGACTFTSKVMRRRFSGISERLCVHRRRRVVHEDVDRAAELLDRLGHDAGAVVAVGEVGGDRPPPGCRSRAMRSAVSLRLPGSVACASTVRATIATAAPSAASRSRDRRRRCRGSRR